MENNNTFIGIDISKNYLDVYISNTNKYKRFKNNALGVEALIKFIGKPEEISRIILEPTGGYEIMVLETLATKSYPVCRVNALQIRLFAGACGILAKTDKLDAKVLAEYGSKMPTRVYMPLSQELKDLKRLVTRRRQLSNMIVEEKNRIKKSADIYLNDMIKEDLEYLINKKKLIEKQITDLIDHHENLSKQREVLTSLKGVGNITAAILMTEMPELGKLTRNQATKLIGVAPLNKESGNMKGKSQIRSGREYVRHTLYLASMSAIQHNPLLSQFYHKLKSKAKPSKVALIAVVHKIIVILNARMMHFFA